MQTTFLKRKNVNLVKTVSLVRYHALHKFGKKVIKPRFDKSCCISKSWVKKIDVFNVA